VAHVWEVYEVYEDAGVSGTKRHRPALDLLLAAASEGKFQHVVFLKLDRLGRSAQVILTLCDALQKEGVELASVQESMDTSTPSGKAMRTVTAAFAELYRDEMVEKMTAGRLGAAEKGVYISGRPPYGWDYDKKAKSLVLNRVEAAVVRDIYRWYVKEGLSQAAIARRLNADEVPTKTLRKSTRGDGIKKGWLTTAIESILTSTRYKGEHYYNRSKVLPRKQEDGPKQSVARPHEEWIQIPCPAIVDVKTWNAARRRAKANKKRSELLPPNREADSEYLLSGLVRCYCGSKMHGMAGGGKRRLGCPSQNRRPDLYHCRSPQRILAETVEQDVLNRLVETFRDPKNVMTLVSAHVEAQQEALATRSGMVATLQEKLAQAEQKRNRVARLHIDGSIPEAHAKRELNRINKDAEVWQEELDRVQAAALQSQDQSEIEATAKEIAGNIQEIVVEEATIQEKRTLIRALVNQVWVDADNNLDIDCVIPQQGRPKSRSVRVPVSLSRQE